MDAPDRDESFGAFFKRYTRTWQHAVATAALTAFGTLTFVHRLFAVVALLAYVLPPVVLYLSGDGTLKQSSDEPGRATPDDHGHGSGGGEAGPSTDAWTTASVPTDETLFDAAVADRAAFAVGAEGTVLADGSDGWTAAVTDGPGAQSNALRGVAAVEGGGVWFAGDGGAVGRLDPETGRHVDHSAPNGDTNNLTGVAAAGTDGDETVLLVDGSGRVRRGHRRDGEMAWDGPVSPGSGSSLVGVTLWNPSSAYACDTSQNVFETRDGGRSFDRLGLDGAAGTFTDVAASDSGTGVVSADDGVVHRLDGATWTPERLGDDPVWAVALHGEHGVAAGDGGVVYEAAAAGWERTATPTTDPLRGVALGRARAVAVGEGGTVVERGVDHDDA